MTQKFQMTLAVCAVLMLPVMAEARGPGQGAAMWPGFEALDTDGSGVVTLEEFQAALEDPRAAQREQMVARLMQEADADGKLDEDALRNGLTAYAEERREARRASMQARMFGRIDANSDGVISAEEYEAFLNRSAGRMERRGMDRRGMDRRGMERSRMR